MSAPRRSRRLGHADHLECEQLVHAALLHRSAARSVAEVAAAGEDHRHVVAVGDLDRHLVADEPPGWMIAVTPRSAASWMASAKGK
jgi:hypothetical protein